MLGLGNLMALPRFKLATRCWAERSRGTGTSTRLVQAHPAAAFLPLPPLPPALLSIASFFPGGQNGFHIMVHRLTQGKLRILRLARALLRLSSGLLRFTQALLRHAHPWLRYAHPQFKFKQQLLTSAN
jgi:hypothetical protein